MKKNKRVLVVDDHVIFRLGVKALLSEIGLDVDEASNGREAMLKLTKNKYTLVLMDYLMPEYTGIEVLQECRKRSIKVPFVFLTALDDSEKLNNLLEVDTFGMISKQKGLDSVVKAVNDVIDGKPYFDSDLIALITKGAGRSKFTRQQTFDADLSSLTKRELMIIDLIAQGLSCTGIAEKLFISKRTVEKHRYNILAKTLHKNFYTLVIDAYMKGLLPLDSEDQAK